MFGAMIGNYAAQKAIDAGHDRIGLGDWQDEQNRKDARWDYAENERQGIMSRVEGAKAAGLHPLAALGFQASSPVSVVGDYGGGGGSYSGGSDPEPPRPKEAEDIISARTRAANARLAEANADAAEFQLETSRKALATQPGNAPVRMPTDPANTTPGQSRGLRPGVVVKPDEVTSGMKGLTSGTHQASTTFRVPGGFKWNLPSDKASQALEDLDLAKYYLLYLANKDRLGKFFTDDLPWATGRDPRNPPPPSKHFKWDGSLPNKR